MINLHIDGGLHVRAFHRPDTKILEAWDVAGYSLYPPKCEIRRNIQEIASGNTNASSDSEYALSFPAKHLGGANWQQPLPLHFNLHKHKFTGGWRILTHAC